MDAPRHFSPGKLSAHDVALESLVGRLFLVDVSEAAYADKDVLVNISHLEAAEASLGRSMNDSVVLVYTGFSEYWPKTSFYLGTNTTNTSLLHFPGLHPHAAQWIVEKRSIKSIGIDTASIDYGQSTTYLSHRHLTGANIPVFENVNLKEVDSIRSKDDDVLIIALPMKIKGGSGAPLRIIATINCCLLYTSPSPRDLSTSRMPSSA